jgi:hypothetical protein
VSDHLRKKREREREREARTGASARDCSARLLSFFLESDSAIRSGKWLEIWCCGLTMCRCLVPSLIRMNSRWQMRKWILLVIPACSCAVKSQDEDDRTAVSIPLSHSLRSDGWTTNLTRLFIKPLFSCVSYAQINQLCSGPKRMNIYAVCVCQPWTKNHATCVDDWLIVRCAVSIRALSGHELFFSSFVV